MTLKRTSLPRTSEGVAAAELRSAIVRGDMTPGAKIRQEATARELGISLIPLREALKTLASEGVVTYHPQRGYFVTELPASAIAEIYVVRGLLEHEAEARAIPRLGADELVVMAAVLRDQAQAVEEEDAVAMVATNRSFHFTIFARCGNAWLLRHITQLWDTLEPYRVMSYRQMWREDPTREDPAAALGEHDRLLVAIGRGDLDRALRLLERHRQRSQTFLRALR
jgi:DNA-binding GntR family transcriptional regulator